MPAFGAPNPIVLRILHSRLHRIMSGALLALTVRGRRSGRSLEFPVMYARDGSEVIVVAAWASKKRWWKNVRGGADVEMLIAGESLRGHAELIPDGAERGRFLRRYLLRFPKAASGLGLDAAAMSKSDSELSSRLGDAELVRIAC